MNLFRIVPQLRTILKKLLILSSILVILIAVAVSGTLAFMSAKTSMVTNEFNPGIADITISEPHGSSYTISNDNTVNKEVAITNVKRDNAVPVYVRVRLVPIMRYASGAEGTGEQVSVSYPDLNTAQWVAVGDYYYYKGILQPGQTTDYLIKTAKVVNGLKSGRKLEIQVIADSVQITSNAELNAWGIPYNNGTWKK